MVAPAYPKKFRGNTLGEKMEPTLWNAKGILAVSKQALGVAGNQRKKTGEQTEKKAGNASFDSLRKILEIAPRMIVSSHRRPITSGIEEEIAAFDAVFVSRNQKILQMLEKGPATPEQLAELSPIYGIEGSSFALAFYFESRMIEKHLELLTRRGLVERTEGGAFQLA